MTTEMTNAEALAVLEAAQVDMEAAARQADPMVRLQRVVLLTRADEVKQARTHFAALAQRLESALANAAAWQRMANTSAHAAREAIARAEAAEARAAELKAEADAWRRKHRKQSKLRAKWRDEAMALRAGRVEPLNTP